VLFYVSGLRLADKPFIQRILRITLQNLECLMQRQVIDSVLLECYQHSFLIFTIVLFYVSGLRLADKPFIQRILRITLQNLQCRMQIKEPPCIPMSAGGINKEKTLN